MPSNIAPMALTLNQEPFNDKDWQFEIKWDGFRMLAYCSGDKVNLSSRRNNNFNKRFSSIKTELEEMKLNAILDGEVVTLDDDGSPNFSNIITPNKKIIPSFTSSIFCGMRAETFWIFHSFNDEGF